HGEDVLPADALRQPAGLVFLGAEFPDIRTYQAAMQRHEKPGIAIAGVLLDQDLLVTEIADTRATVFLIGPHQQQTLFAGFEESLAIDDSLLVPTIRVRQDLVFHERTDRITKHVVFFLEYVSGHVWCPDISIR